jgi:methyl-accepting chemotaxis protein
MKIDPADRRTGASEGTETDGGTRTEPSGTDEHPQSESALTSAEPLTIALPDGSESVSEAILSHRQMLTNPSDHGLVSAEEAEEVRETVDRLVEEVPEDLSDEMADLETSVDELADGLDRQQRQIQELRDTVASLAEILGASVEFRTGDDES